MFMRYLGGGVGHIKPTYSSSEDASMKEDDDEWEDVNTLATTIDDVEMIQDEADTQATIYVSGSEDSEEEDGEGDIDEDEDDDTDSDLGPEDGEGVNDGDDDDGYASW
jgi:hypothetical protein